MILPRVAFPDAVLHQAGKRRQHVDAGVDPTAEQIPAEHQLPLGDIARQIRDGMVDVVVRHGEDGHLGNGAGPVHKNTGALVERGQVTVEIPGVPLPAGHLPALRGEFAERLAVVGHIRHDDQHVHIPVEGQELGQRQGHARGHDALHGRVIGEVQEHRRVRERAGFRKGGAEELGVVVLDAHGTKDDGKALVARGDARLAGDLGGQFVVRQPSAGEHRQFLPADEGVHAVDGGDARHDEVARIGAPGGVDRRAVHVPAILGDGRGDAIHRLAEAVQHPPEHRRRHRSPQGLPGKPHPGARHLQPAGAAPHLHYGGSGAGLEHAAPPDLAIGQQHLGGLIVAHPAGPLDDDDRP